MTYELMVLVVPSVDMTTDAAQKELIGKLVGGTVKIEELTSLGKKS